MYTKESLIACNNAFFTQHPRGIIEDRDAQQANELSALIEFTRCNNHPMPGDVVEFTTRYGDWYPNAHIQTVDGDDMLICESTWAPCVKEESGKIDFWNVSGGAWTEIPAGLRKVGERRKKFRFTANFPACCNILERGFIEFEANVNVWTYSEPNPRYGEYTRRQYDRFYVHFPKEPDPFARRILVSGVGDADCYATIFNTEREYLAWLATYKGAEFQNEDGIVAHLYRQREQLISKEEWDALSLPIDTRQSNGLIDVKCRVDDETKIITEYRYCNGGSPLNCHYDKPYGRAMELISSGKFARNIMEMNW